MAKRKLRTLRHALVTIALTGALVPAVSASTAGVAAAATVPKDFMIRDTQVELTTGDSLTDFAYLTDKSVLAITKNGQVKWIPESGAQRTVTTLPSTYTTVDMGLMSLALAPDFDTSHTIYLTRAIQSGSGFVMRLSKYTMTLDSAGVPNGVTGEQPLFEVPGLNNAHGIDTVIAATDGTLWMSIGDNADYTKMDPGSMRSQDVTSPYGKILHLTTDGKGVSTNPYYDAANPGSTVSKVFARGFRNPFRFSIDPKLGLPVAGDVGYDDWEEVDVVQRGGNYGWPCWEAGHATKDYKDQGFCQGVPNTAPTYEYPHGTVDNTGHTAIGGVVYTGESYPAVYRGAYFFGDYFSKQIWTITYNDKGTLTRGPETPPAFKDMGGPVKFGTAPNGDIVYADIYSGKLRRLSYVQGNKPPIVSVTSTTDPDTRTVSFDGSASVDYDNDPMTFTWDFGDGTPVDTKSGAKVTHVYAAGTEKFTATLKVSDPLGLSDTQQITVAPGNHSPVLTLTPPTAANFAVGEPVHLEATATDAEDGALTVQWGSKLIHCPDASSCHEHGDSTGTGPVYERPFTDHPDGHMLFTAVAIDSVGVKTVKTYEAWPRQHRVTLVSTQPAALSIASEGGVKTGLVAENANLQLIAPALAMDGVSKFTGWQGGPTTQEWDLKVGTTDATYTANYDTPIDQRYNGDAALQAKLGAPTAAEVTDGTIHFRTYANGRIYWSKDTGAKYMTGPILTKYLALGGHGVLGAPMGDTVATADGVGQFTHFFNWASIFYSPSTGAHLVKGRIRDKYAEWGYERGLGYPTVDESATPDGRGFYNHFQGATLASIYWTPTTDAHVIKGEIRKKWASLDYERGLGYPTVDEGITSDRNGWYNHFDKGASIFYTGATGAHYIKGSIWKLYSGMGYEQSYLKYPTSDEYVWSTGWRNDFQGGYITYIPPGPNAVAHPW